MAVATPRPDFDGAVTEFLIGLLAVALAPVDEVDWEGRWQTPPTQSELAAALAALPAAFDLASEGPAFLQDWDRAEVMAERESRVEQLLCDAPGEQSIKLNKDLFFKRNLVPTMGLPGAAMALVTLQSYAPAGGQGHRVSLRGGGPLTTLVDPRPELETSRASELSLWRLLWANVPTEELLGTLGGKMDGNPNLIFPWLAATNTSSGKSPKRVFPSDAHPLQAFFGMPRRIRLAINPAPTQCAITGRDSSCSVTAFHMKNFGVSYEKWVHPLTPYYQSDQGFLPTHGSPQGLGWRDWGALTLGYPDGTRLPASVVTHFARHRARITGCDGFRLHAFGYDFDNMKARGWVSARLPLLAVSDDRAEDLRAMAYAFVEATSLVASLTHGAIERAMFPSGMKAGDAIEAKRRIWDALEGPFFREIVAISDLSDGDHPGSEHAERFLGDLVTAALRVFDEHCMLGSPDPTTVRRVVSSRRDLWSSLRGYGKMGSKLRTKLGLPDAQASPSKGEKKPLASNLGAALTKRTRSR